MERLGNMERLPKFKAYGPYVTPPQKLTSVGGLEALRKAVDEEYLRAGNVFTPIHCEGRRRFTGFTIAVIKRAPPPYFSNQMITHGGNYEEPKIDLEAESAYSSTQRTGIVPGSAGSCPDDS